MSEKRTTAEIEAELEAIRQELTRNVDELTDRLDPKAQLDRLKQSARDCARKGADTITGLVKSATGGDPQAIAILAGGAITAVALVVTLGRRGNR